MPVNKFFDYKAHLSDDEGEEKSHGAYVSTYRAMHFEKVANLREDLVRIPTQGEIFFLQSDSAFNAFTFIELLVSSFRIKELHATTYSISRKVIDAIIELHDRGAVEQVTLLISDSMIKRNPVTIDNLRAMASTRPNVKVLYAWVHAKVCLLRTDQAHFVIEGSGNWSENAHYEQYLMVDDKGLYDFRMKLFTETKLKQY
ncbi:phospholipase D-like domain-containing protein [Flavobacterium rhizosphaerae]|uniref:Phospholipase D-like domain-containing protein n=1 Tax=Flavobacterium rhizosphaerae TaxID=3163298 RepID=A0ABW8YWS1_9FLAO